MTKRLKSIHVGVGGRGTWPVKLMTADPRWQPVALVDVSRENLQAARQMSGLSEKDLYADLGKAIEEHPEADAVVVVTPSALHAQFIETALRAGKHVLTEKPFTNSEDDARRLVAMAEEKGLAIVVAQNYRFRPVERMVQKILRERTYGEPSYMTLIHHRHRPEVRSFTMAQPMIYEMSVHHFDSILAMFGRRPKAVTANSFNPPWSKYPGPAAVQALIELEGPVYITYLGTFTSMSNSWTNRIECEKAAVSWSTEPALRVTYPDGRVTEIPVSEEVVSPEQQILDQFYDQIVSGRESEVSGRNNLATMQLVQAAIRSSEQGIKVTLP